MTLTWHRACGVSCLFSCFSIFSFCLKFPLQIVLKKCTVQFTIVPFTQHKAFAAWGEQWWLWQSKYPIAFFFKYSSITHQNIGLIRKMEGRSSFCTLWAAFGSWHTVMDWYVDIPCMMIQMNLSLCKYHHDDYTTYMYFNKFPVIEEPNKTDWKKKDLITFY